MSGPFPGDSTRAELLDYSDTLGGFLFWSPKGQLFALERFLVSPNFGKIVPQLSDAQFHVVYPLLSRMRDSSITVVLHPGERAHAYFLTELKAGPTRRTVKVFQEPGDIVANALGSGMFPVIHFGELQSAVVASRQNKSPLSIRIRLMALRPGLSQPLLDAVSQTFLANAKNEGDKTVRMQHWLERVERELKRTMIESYLVKCVWLDPRTGLLGKMVCNEEKCGFSKFLTGDPDITEFSRALARREDGRFVVRSGVANVLPAMLPALKWNSPTVHVYDEAFRTANRLQEHYSLYEGLKALCRAGAPVLLHQGYELPNAIPVYLLEPAAARRDAAHLAIRGFPTRHLVWNA